MNLQMKLGLDLFLVIFIYWNMLTIEINGLQLEKTTVAYQHSHPYPFETVRYRSLDFPNDIMRDIKRAFEITNIEPKTLNNMMKVIFNSTSLNPKYIFQLSDKPTINLIMHRSDFETPLYPNLTATYMQLAKLSKRGNLNLNPKIDKEYDFHRAESTRVKGEKLSDDSDFHSEIVKANTATESNFINYVNRLNAKGEKLENSKNSIEKTKGYLKKIENKKLKKSRSIGVPKVKFMKRLSSKGEIDWDALGLAGWEGELLLPKVRKYPESGLENLQVDPAPPSEVYIIDENRNPENVFEVEIPGDYGFLDASEKNAVWDLPGKISSSPLKRQPPRLLGNNDEIIRNMTNLLIKDAKPKWPLTVRRDEHKDDDVYIARSNNQFGYSTKWEFKNKSKKQLKLGLRSKRGVIELYSMIKCSTGCDPIIFKGYGCYCGFMGSGTPVDGIDRCCKQHDTCYQHSKCPSYLEYFIPYLWKCYKGKPLCAVDHGEWGGPRSCADQLCTCDLEFSRCLRKFLCPRRRAVCKTSYARMIQNYLMIL